MKKRTITIARLKLFRQFLLDDEKSEATIEKYMRDMKHFLDFAGDQHVDKALSLSYKIELEKKYALVSANSMIASLNTFFRFCGWHECCIKQFKVQKKTFCSEEKELTKDEYIQLVKTAENIGKERLGLILQTICGTGIRVSELKFITVESLQRGEAMVSCKGKTRTVFIVKELRRKLARYAKKRRIASGPIFITRGGKPVNRSNIWREMKELCDKAGVSPSKVFPHNLRHLFARVFYRLEKDIAKLADVLGHTNINTTRVYIITTGAEHKRRMESMKLII